MGYSWRTYCVLISLPTPARLKPRASIIWVVRLGVRRARWGYVVIAVLAYGLLISEAASFKS